MTPWELMHEYRRLAAAGSVEYLECWNDDEELVPVVNPLDFDMPSLRCLVCGNVIEMTPESIRNLRVLVQATQTLR